MANGERFIPNGIPTPPSLGGSIALDSILGNYKIERLLGRGGQAEVFLAHDLALHRKAAIKVFRDGRVPRSIAEGRLLARLSHPNIVQVYHLESSAPPYYMAMEYIAGADLLDRVRRFGPLDPSQALAVLRDVLAGLRHAHAVGVIHRDVKPQNLLGGFDQVVKIADFGLATLVDAERKSEREHAVGTPGYMAPEIWHGGTPNPASDLYSVGCVLFFTLTGRPPFAGRTSGALSRAHLVAHPRLPVELPQPLVRLVENLMAKDPAKRIPTAADALEEVGRCESALRGHRRAGHLPREPRVAVGATAEIFDLPHFADAKTRLRRIVGSVVALVCVSGSNLYYPSQLAERVLESCAEDVMRTAAIRLRRQGSSDLCSVIQEIAQTRVVDVETLKRGSMPSVAAIAETLAPDRRRRALLVVAERDLHPAEVTFLAELARDAQRRNLCILVVCYDAQASTLVDQARALHRAARVDVLRVPDPTPEQALVHAHLWAREAGVPSSRRWSAPALALGADWAVRWPDHMVRILGNAEVLALRHGLPVLTTWCLRAAAEHPELLSATSPLLAPWRERPPLWPDLAEFERWRALPRDGRVPEDAPPRNPR